MKEHGLATPEELPLDTPKILKNFVETAAFGCPAAQAAVLAQPRDDGYIEQEETDFMKAAQAKPVALRATDSEGGCPHTIKGSTFYREEGPRQET